MQKLASNDSFLQNFSSCLVGLQLQAPAWISKRNGSRAPWKTQVSLPLSNASSHDMPSFAVLAQLQHATAWPVSSCLRPNMADATTKAYV